MIVLYWVLPWYFQHGFTGGCMKRILFIICIFSLVLVGQLLSAQTIVEIGDLPKSEYSINVYQVYGFQEGYEGYKLVYIDNNNKPQPLYLPAALRENYRIYKPDFSSGALNFVIIWKKGDRVERIEWFMPKAINYDLPNFSIKPFGEKDREVFTKIVESGELVLGGEISGAKPQITAPGGQ
jgi:hypothetical protein